MAIVTITIYIKTFHSYHNLYQCGCLESGQQERLIAGEEDGNVSDKLKSNNRYMTNIPGLYITRKFIITK